MSEEPRKKKWILWILLFLFLGLFAREMGKLFESGRFHF